MGDLISKSVLIKNISKVCGDIGVVLPDQVWDIITAQPTAYDLEKVVEQEENFLVNFGIPKDTKVHRKIIDIVRKGGVE